MAEMQAAKDFSNRMLGGVDLLFNNAGIAYNARPFWEIPADAVQRSYDANVFGVINGVRAFVPEMMARGTGYIMNTASIGGFQVSDRLDLWHQGLCASTKYAVVALTEALALEVKARGIGVSILAPGAVATGIAHSGRDFPGITGELEGGASAAMEEVLAKAGMDPILVADMAIAGLLRKELYVFTHAEFRGKLAERARNIDASFEVTAAREHEYQALG